MPRLNRPIMEESKSIVQEMWEEVWKDIRMRVKVVVAEHNCSSTDVCVRLLLPLVYGRVQRKPLGDQVPLGYSRVVRAQALLFAYKKKKTATC